MSEVDYSNEYSGYGSPLDAEVDESVVVVPKKKVVKTPSMETVWASETPSEWESSFFDDPSGARYCLVRMLKELRKTANYKKRFFGLWEKRDFSERHGTTVSIDGVTFNMLSFAVIKDLNLEVEDVEVRKRKRVPSGGKRKKTKVEVQPEVMADILPASPQGGEETVDIDLNASVEDCPPPPPPPMDFQLGEGNSVTLSPVSEVMSDFIPTVFRPAYVIPAVEIPKPVMLDSRSLLGTATNPVVLSSDISTGLRYGKHVQLTSLQWTKPPMGYDKKEPGPYSEKMGLSFVLGSDNNLHEVNKGMVSVDHTRAVSEASEENGYYLVRTPQVTQTFVAQNPTKVFVRTIEGKTDHEVMSAMDQPGDVVSFLTGQIPRVSNPVTAKMSFFTRHRNAGSYQMEEVLDPVEHRFHARNSYYVVLSSSVVLNPKWWCGHVSPWFPTMCVSGNMCVSGKHKSLSHSFVDLPKEGHALSSLVFADCSVVSAIYVEVLAGDSGCKYERCNWQCKTSPLEYFCAVDCTYSHVLARPFGMVRSSKARSGPVSRSPLIRFPDLSLMSDVGRRFYDHHVQNLVLQVAIGPVTCRRPVVAHRLMVAHKRSLGIRYWAGHPTNVYLRDYIKSLMIGKPIGSRFDQAYSLVWLSGKGFVGSIAQRDSLLLSGGDIIRWNTEKSELLEYAPIDQVRAVCSLEVGSHKVENRMLGTCWRLIMARLEVVRSVEMEIDPQLSELLLINGFEITSVFEEGGIRSKIRRVWDKNQLRHYV